MRDGSIKYNGALHALSSIIGSEGIAGLYRGLWPNLREFLSYFLPSSLCAELMMWVYACSQGCPEHSHIVLHL